MKLSSSAAVLLGVAVAVFPGASAAQTVIANAVLLLASLSSSNAATSFLRATVSSDDALACLGGCADDSIYTDKKKHLTTNKIYSSATECSKDCLPASKRDATTIACTDKCYKNQAKSVVKTQDKAIKSAADDIIKQCKKKCDKDDSDCLKKCDKTKVSSSTKNVSKEVAKKVPKVLDSTKNCLAKCLTGEVDFMMDSMYYEEDFEDFIEGNDDDECKNINKEKDCDDDEDCKWNNYEDKCEKKKKDELDFERKQEVLDFELNEESEEAVVTAMA